jgi:hypothetical protein
LPLSHQYYLTWWITALPKDAILGW